MESLLKCVSLNRNHHDEMKKEEEEELKKETEKNKVINC